MTGRTGDRPDRVAPEGIGPSAWARRGPAYAGSDVHRHGPSLPRLVALLRPQRNDRILDLGTGTGHTAAHLARWSDDVTGVDPEAGMLAAARAAYGDRPGVAFVRAAAEDLPFDAASFDAVVARHTLHHHRDVGATLRAVRRVLRPGGRFVFVDETAPAEDHRPWLERLERLRDPSHVATRSLETWADLLAAAGLAWVVGDARTRYRLDVASWLDRMDAPQEVRDGVHAMLREAPAGVRDAFSVVMDGARPVCFDLPMNVVLAVKEEA